jgi:hypothetical protein
MNKGKVLMEHYGIPIALVVIAIPATSLPKFAHWIFNYLSN